MTISDAAEKKIDELERELLGLQQMLYFVLTEIGEPVVVTKERLERGIEEDTMLNIDEDIQTDSFVFSVVKVPNEQ